MTIQHIIVRDVMNTRFVLFKRTTGKTEIRYIDGAGSSEPIDRLLSLNPDLDRGDGRIVSPEFNTAAAVQDYLTSLDRPDSPIAA